MWKGEGIDDVQYKPKESFGASLSIGQLAQVQHPTELEDCQLVIDRDRRVLEQQRDIVLQIIYLLHFLL